MDYRILALGDVASETGLQLLEKKLIGNGDTAQNQGTALHQTVHVVAVPDAQIYHACTSRRCRNSSATDRSSGVVILIFSRHPGVK